MAYRHTVLEELQYELPKLLELIDKVKEEAEEYYSIWKIEVPDDEKIYPGGTINSGALRRKSMDVTRLLAELRRRAYD